MEEVTYVLQGGSVAVLAGCCSGVGDDGCALAGLQTGKRDEHVATALRFLRGVLVTLARVVVVVHGGPFPVWVPVRLRFDGHLVGGVSLNAGWPTHAAPWE
jgi:hypothetical protein